MKRIMVLGGSFDPPHLGHEQLVKYVIENKLAEEVWLVPCGEHAFSKNSQMSPKKDRLEMTKLLVDELNNENGGAQIVASAVEVEREGTSFTFDTLEQIAKDNLEAQVMFLMGEDQLKDFEKWHKWEELLSKYLVFVYPRGVREGELKKGMVYWASAPRIETASSMIRKEREGGGVVLNTRESVRKYIEDNHLYARKN